MSVVVAIKADGKVYMAADSMCCSGYSKTTLSNPNNYKMWKTKGLSNSIMGHTGMARDVGVVKIKNFIPELRSLKGNIDYDFVQGELVFNIYDECMKRGFIDEDEEGPHLSSGYLFAYKDKVYSIDRDLYVAEIDDYYARGSGKDSAMGSLESTQNEPVETRLIKAIVSAANVDLFVDYPIIITDTESCEFKVYDKNDVKKVLENG